MADAPAPALVAATFETVRYLMCPACGNRMSSIDHLQLGQTFGPWSCGALECRASISGRVTADGADIIVDREGNEHRPQFALLKFRDLYLVLLDKYGTTNPDYFYHSHQCPTNLLRNVAHVFDTEGSDPHGTMRFVARVPWSTESAKTLDSMGGIAELFAFFQTDGQPAPTDWPEENAGVLPFVVDLQRDYTKKRSPKA